MTFAARTFQGLSALPGIITSPSVTIQNTSPVTGIRSGSFSLVNDGTLTKINGTGSTSWFTPTTTGIGSSVWVNVALTSNTNTTVGGTTGSWVSLAASPSWNFTNTATNNEGIGTFTLSFASDSAGANIVGTGSGGWDVGFAP